MDRRRHRPRLPHRDLDLRVPDRAPLCDDRGGLVARARALPLHRRTGAARHPLAAGGAEAVKASSYTLLADEVLTLDARGMTYSPGAVVIEGDSISYVGPPQPEKSGTVIHLDGCALLPGLVDVHTHTPMWLFRGLTEDVPRGEWLQARMRPLETLVGPSELRAGALAGCLELLTSGVTTIADRYSEMGEVAGAVEESGLRAVLAPTVLVAHGTYLTDGEADLVGRRGTAVAHCPSSNAKLEARVAPVGRMRRSGAVVGLGTDAACCNNGMDLFAEMRTAGLLN